MARVVVIGGGYGGITVAGGLDDIAEVILVEQKDQFVHHAAALRAAVDPVWSQTIFMPYNRLLRNGQVIHAPAMGIEGNKVYVAGHDPIEADYIVLATGSTYPYPAKHMVSTAKVAQARLTQTRENLKHAKSVLLVGVGTVGIEFAGELSSVYPDLEIIMVEKEERILPTHDYTDELRKVIHAQLEERGIKIVAGSPLAYNPPVDMGALSRFQVETRNGEKIEADMWFQCYGAQTASGYLAHEFSDLMRPNGQISVDKYMRVQGHNNVYAVGDITDVKESKRADAARAHARVVVANIRDEIEGRSPSTTYSAGKEWVILPLGPDGGASQLVEPNGDIRIVGPDETAQIKGTDLMVSMIRSQLRLP
ncbi:FAD-dependent oxidoreductase [Boudabousia marimammalium]|uniref:FAD-dependent oxidoreductase n=1 Tax=Boudabousia marimammalium TaxID=156892 RepID=A0A1Q5PR58_9ACTO|nr:FAD-dependent oxidoreductase [Boudabousia marimammalium]OKL50047.1 FAD-dependent oxidoreductase [Boudabousia marimammalium]